MKRTGNRYSNWSVIGMMIILLFCSEGSHGQDRGPGATSKRLPGRNTSHG